MSVTYFKRYKMELKLSSIRDVLNQQLDLAGDSIGFSVPNHPDGSFFMLPWSPQLLGQHSQVKWESFREELDSHVFPCLGDLDGCKQLMREISSRKNFVAEATWLACRNNEFSDGFASCGTVQGLLNSSYEGAIQNLGVHPDCRDLGVGSALLRQAILGFWKVGCQYVNLEVTVQNAAAIRLYERMGFRKVETLFKISEVQYAS